MRRVLLEEKYSQEYSCKKDTKDFEERIETSTYMIHLWQKRSVNKRISTYGEKK